MSPEGTFDAVMTGEKAPRTESLMPPNGALNGITPSQELSRAEQPPRTFSRLWARLGLAAILLLAAGLRLWRLDQNGYGTTYYTAAVRSMMDNGHNFFYASFDPAGFVSVDKPPVALWVQVASAKLFGFSGLSVIVPQVVEGIAAVLLTYYLVHRRFGVWAASLAGLAMAVTPVSIAVDRGNNTDSCLVLVILLAAWALTRAAETGRRSFLLLAVALVGVGFNVKMLAAFVVLPAFYLVYFLGAPVGWRRRLVDLTLATVVLAAVSLSWPVAYDLTPADQRPYAGSSKENSMLELAIGHNGIDRFIRRGRFGMPPRANPSDGNPPAAAAGTAPADGNGRPASPAGGANQTAAPPLLPGGAPGAAPGTPGAPGGFGRGFFGRNAPAGILRLANRHLAGQVLWLFPLAIVGLLAAAAQVRWRWTLDPGHQSLLLWFGWLITYGLVFSYAGGIFHAYYLVMLAPPMAALAGIGVVALWTAYRRGGWRTLWLPAALLLTAAWQAYVWFDYADLSRWITPSLLLATGAAAVGLLVLRASRTSLFFPFALLVAAGWQAYVRDEDSDLSKWVTPSLLLGTAVAAAGLIVLGLSARRWQALRRWTPAALAAGWLALLLSPGVWALTPLAGAGNLMLPAADPSVFTRRADADPFRAFRNPMDTQKLVAFAKANHQGERFLLATPSTQQAAPIIIETGEPVMAMGGFMGSDPILTPEKIAQLVENRELRFVMVSSFGLGMPGGGTPAGTNPGGSPPSGGTPGASTPGGDRWRNEVTEWVRKHGKEVPREQWGGPPPPRSAGNDTSGQRPPQDSSGNAANDATRQPPAQAQPGGPAAWFGGFRGRMGFTNLYDLRPETGTVPAPSGSSDPEAK